MYVREIAGQREFDRNSKISGNAGNEISSDYV